MSPKLLYTIELRFKPLENLNVFNETLIVLCLNLALVIDRQNILINLQGWERLFKRVFLRCDTGNLN